MILWRERNTMPFERLIEVLPFLKKWDCRGAEQCLPWTMLQGEHLGSPFLQVLLGNQTSILGIMHVSTQLFLFSLFLFHHADFKPNYFFQGAISTKNSINRCCPKCIDYVVYSLAIYQYSASRRLDDVTKKVCKAVSTCRLQLSGLCQSVSSVKK